MTWLPPTWTVRRLAQVCLPIAKLDPAATGRETVRYVDIGSVDGETHTLASVGSVRALEAPSRARQVLASGDTVFSTVRPYLEKIAFIGSDLEGEFASTGFCVLRPGHDVVPRYLFHFAGSRSLLDQVLPHQRGVSYPAVLNKDVLASSIPVPPLGEQLRIVDILEDHLSRLDAASNAIRANVKRLTVFSDALVRAEITGDAATGARRVTSLSASGVDDGDLSLLPDGWAWVRLGELADVVGGVTKDAKRQADPAFVEVPYLRVANVQRGRLDLSTVTTIRVPSQKAEALRLLPGDVLLNEGGDRDKLGRGWVWEGQIADCIHQNHVFRARVRDSQIDPLLVSWAANTIGGRWCDRNGTQSVNLASISLRKIRLMPIPVPPAGEQSAIVRRVQDAVEASERLRGELQRVLARAQSLRRALLEAAFSGRLTGSSSDMDRVEELAGI